ncbi:MAG: (d)CMP kinase [Oscillospiraceae bacterium]|nr:(d)CMP kinase [Oscillospiraceae bacterium]
MVSIAIDGPSGAGKSTLSRRLAETLGFLYVDTGALYRALGLYALRRGVSPSDPRGVQELLPGVGVSLAHGPGGQRVFVNGEDVTDAIRAHDVSGAASDISALPAVRAYLLDTQRAFARAQSVVMDGRDIGTVVLPDADLKIFLTATPEDRARRRHRELLDKGACIDYETVLRDLKVRDRNDEMRAAAPLRPAPDAVVLDTTGNAFEMSYKLLLGVVKGKLASCSTEYSTE